MISTANVNETINITDAQKIKFHNFLNELKNYNTHTNIVGKSTLINPWKSHILDCIQVASFIDKKNNSVLDMGTGAGLPGIVLAIAGYNNVTMVDSNNKKIHFIKNVCKKLNIKNKVLLSRIEKMPQKKYDYITSRALAKLSQLFSYSYNFINKKTVLIFLKGRTASEEIAEAKKKWSFESISKTSLSDERGKVLIIKKLSLKK